MRDVVVVTGRNMPHGPAVETPMLVDALVARGLDAAIEPWGTEASLAGRLVVIRTTWDYTAELDAFLGWARDVAAVTELINPLGVIEWNAHKSYLPDLAYAAVPVIPTTLVAHDAAESVRHAALEEYAGEVVIKPAVSVGAIGTLRTLGDSGEALGHLDALLANGDALVQPFLPAVTDGEVSLIYFGDEFSHAVRKVPAPGDFRVQSFLGGTVHHHVPSEAELELGTAALAAVPEPVAYARVDLLNTASGPLLMELELIEPQLFLDEIPESAGRLADELIRVLGDNR